MLKIPIHAHGFSTSTYTPVECLNIDFIGPFTDGGYVLVIIDTFTRWVELYHTKDASALSAAQRLLKHFGRFGAPLSSTHWIHGPGSQTLDLEPGPIPT
jgi:transposase InsO family protein